MWTTQSETEVPNSPSAPKQAPVASLSASAAMRPSFPTARDSACLGSSMQVKGEIHGHEDMQIDGKVEGPISLQDQRLVVGCNAQLNSEITAREIVVYGKVIGNLRARDRVEIKKEGSMIGDITAARVRIEDGAYLKGRIEIERAKSPAPVDLASVGVPVLTEAN